MESFQNCRKLIVEVFQLQMVLGNAVSVRSRRLQKSLLAQFADVGFQSKELRLQLLHRFVHEKQISRRHAFQGMSTGGTATFSTAFSVSSGSLFNKPAINAATICMTEQSNK